MSDKDSPTSNGATGSPPATDNGANVDQPATQSPSGNDSQNEDIQSQIDKAVGLGMQRERKKLEAEYAPLKAELAEIKAQQEDAKLDGMKPEEILEKYKASQAEIQELQDFKAGVVSRRKATLQTQAEGLQSEDAKAYVATQLEAGNLDGAEAFMAALGGKKAPDPAANQHNAGAPTGLSAEIVERFRKAAKSGDAAVLKELSEKHGWDALRKADQAL